MPRRPTTPPRLVVLEDRTVPAGFYIEDPGWRVGTAKAQSPTQSAQYLGPYYQPGYATVFTQPPDRASHFTTNTPEHLVGTVPLISGPIGAAVSGAYIGIDTDEVTDGQSLVVRLSSRIYLDSYAAPDKDLPVTLDAATELAADSGGGGVLTVRIAADTADPAGTPVVVTLMADLIAGTSLPPDSGVTGTTRFAATFSAGAGSQTLLDRAFSAQDQIAGGPRVQEHARASFSTVTGATFGLSVRALQHFANSRPIGVSVGSNFYLNAVVSRADSPPRPTDNRTPVLIVPGIGGVFPTDDQVAYWSLHRGPSPDILRADPLSHVYDDLIQTFKNAGYVEKVNLFVANYDWRLNPGPPYRPEDDTKPDGHISGLTGEGISSGSFRYSVDYLGYWLRQAAEAWASRFPGQQLPAVDIVAHSTGGLVTRTYIQSDAYGGVYDTATGRTLPKVRNFVMYDVPNQGASKPWNLLHNNWRIDLPDPTYAHILSTVIDRAFQKVLRGATIAGADYPISLADLVGGSDDDRREFARKYDISRIAGSSSSTAFHRSHYVENVRRRFISLYVPTMRALLPTYDFLDLGYGPLAINDKPYDRNDLLLDLNGGADRNGFVGTVAADGGRVIAVYGDGVDTPTTVRKFWQPVGGRRGDFQISFDESSAVFPAPGEEWYRDQFRPAGDGTVPLESLVGQFLLDDRVVKLRFEKGQNTQYAVSHTKMPSNPDAQLAILGQLGQVVAADQISKRLAGITLGSIASVAHLLLDPVEGFLVDGEGRRLGYSAATGPLTEIPDSVWLGGADGFGFVFGPVAGTPTLRLSGLGGPYYAAAAVYRDGQYLSATGLGDDLPSGQSVEMTLVPGIHAGLFAAGAGEGGGPVVATYAAGGAEVGRRFAFDPSFTGGVRTASADFDGDGVDDVAVGTGPGIPTLVRILSGFDGRELFAVAPFEASFGGGVFVAAGDLDGDGVPDLVVTPDEGGGPRVRVFGGAGFGLLADFFGIEDPAFRGGARPAVGDLDGDGYADLVVAAGFGGGPRVAAFGGKSLGSAPVKLFADFLAFEPSLRNGAFVAAGDVDGDGFGDLVAGGGPGGGPRVAVFAGKDLLANTQTRLTDYFAGDAVDRGGVRVAVANLDGDGRADVVTGSGSGSGDRVTGYTGISLSKSPSPPPAFDLDAFPGFVGGVFVG